MSTDHRNAQFALIIAAFGAGVIGPGFRSPGAVHSRGRRGVVRSSAESSRHTRWAPLKTPQPQFLHTGDF